MIGNNGHKMEQMENLSGANWNALIQQIVL